MLPIEETERNSESIFEKSRLEYCIQCYEHMLKGQENIEKKAQVYLSFATIFLGAVFLNLNYLKSLKEIFVNDRGSISSMFAYGAIISIGVFLITLLISVIMCLRLRAYLYPFPETPSISLFDYDSGFVAGENNRNFLRSCALNYAICAEEGSKVNVVKKHWLRVCELSIVIVVLSLLVFVAIIGFRI